MQLLTDLHLNLEKNQISSIGIEEVGKAMINLAAIRNIHLNLNFNSLGPIAATKLA